jgi:hypothetical protein
MFASGVMLLSDFLVSAAPLFIRFADTFASAVDDRLRDKMPSVGTLPLLYNAVVVPRFDVSGGKVSPSRAPTAQPFYLAISCDLSP